MSLTLDTLDRKPRKCLDSSAIVAYKTEGKYLFYFPREDCWYKKEPIYLQSDDGIFFCAIIYIAGWTKNELKPGQDELLCEVHNETKNEWQFIRSFSVELKAFLGLIAVDGEVYVVGYYRPSVTGLLRVQCYDPESDEWKLKTEISIPWDERAQRQFKICDTMKVFQGSLSSSQFTPCLTQDSSQTRQTHHRRDKRKCSIV